MTINDTAEFVWDYLKTNAAAATFRTMITSGAANVLEAGDLSIDILNAAMQTRRDASALSDILAVSVQDSGESLTQRRLIRRQPIVVRLFDRGRGYRNIRTVRIELIRILDDVSGGITVGESVGTLELLYGGRSGNNWDRAFDVQYEGVVFNATVVYQEAY